MNKIVERINREGVTLDKNYNSNSTFTYHAGGNLITFPSFNDLDIKENAFSLAHELGHHYQFIKGSDSFFVFSSLARTKGVTGLIFYPFLLWQEIDAWIKALRICREEEIALDGFFPLAIKSISSYFIFFFNQLIELTKIVFGLYISVVFLIRFLIISEEMKLQQFEWMHDIRVWLVTTPSSNQEIISDMYQSILMFYFFAIIIQITLRMFGVYNDVRQLKQ